MFKKKVNSLSKIIASKNGEGLLLFIFLLIPVVFFVPAIALDLSAYQATKVHLENALEVASNAALNKSIVDDYRSDKILKLKDMNTFATNLKEGIEKNFHATIISSGDTEIKFTPGYAFTPEPAILTITYERQEEDGLDPNDPNRHNGLGNIGININLELTTELKLPITSKFLQVFGISDGSSLNPSITVTDRVCGVRVIKADDFTTDYDWQNKEKE